MLCTHGIKYVFISWRAEISAVNFTHFLYLAFTICTHLVSHSVHSQKLNIILQVRLIPTDLISTGIVPSLN